LANAIEFNIERIGLIGDPKMIDILKSLLAMTPESAWRAPLHAVASLATSALAPLFVISSRILTEPSDTVLHPRTATLVQGRLARAATARSASLEPRPAGAHWRQIALGIEDRLRSARRAGDLQSAALVQIDAADFTLANIIEDLTAVMPRAAELRVLPSRSRPVPARALAA